MPRLSSPTEPRPSAVDTSPAIARRFIGSRPRSGPDSDRPTPPSAPSLSPHVSMPDIGVQLASCPPEAERGALCAALRDALAGPDADVRAVDFEGTCRIGVWLRAARSAEDAAARGRGMRHLRLLARGETFAMFASSAWIARRFNDAFAASPKRLSADGRPSAEGPIHLTSAWLTWESPNRVVTHVRGFDEDPWPEVAFEVATTDTIETSCGELCSASEQAARAEPAWLEGLSGALRLRFTLPVGAIGDGETQPFERGGADVHAGAGAGALSLFPKEILLPDLPQLGPAKALFWYTRSEVNAGGLFAGGEHWLLPRIPKARIAGPAQIAVDRRSASVKRRYSVSLQEMQIGRAHV